MHHSVKKVSACNLLYIDHRGLEMKKLILIFLFIPTLMFAETGLDIVRKLDQNQGYGTQKYSLKMTITRGKRQQIKTFYGYGKDRGNQSFIEFTNPEDRGVKYLKKSDELWIYLPEADDIMKISGPLLRQGMMGSDLSYEDMMRDEKLEERYDVKLVGSEMIRGVDCHKIELNAKVKDALYDRQVIFIDKQRPVALKLDLYARGGRLIKTMEQSDVRNIQGKFVPFKAEITDTRKKNSRTVLEFVSIQFNAEVPDNVFTNQYLRR